MEVKKNRNLMTVSAFAKLCKVTPRTIKYYEEMGILFPHTVQENGYRLYDITQADDLSCILLFQEYGFSLKEIRELMSRHDFNAIFKRLALQKEIISQKKQELLRQEQLVDDSLRICEKHRNIPIPFLKSYMRRRPLYVILSKTAGHTTLSRIICWTDTETAYTTARILFRCWEPIRHCPRAICFLRETVCAATIAAPLPPEANILPC